MSIKASKTTSKKKWKKLLYCKTLQKEQQVPHRFKPREIQIEDVNDNFQIQFEDLFLKHLDKIIRANAIP